MTTPLRRNPKKTVVRLRISLIDVTPTIWRQLLVPGGITLSTLHSIFQAAMGWEDCHLHAFEIDGERYGIADPEEDDDDIDEATVVLGELVSSGTRFLYEYDFGDSWCHEVIVESVDAVPTILKFAVCHDGQRACPPEDCGGPSGYRELVGVIGNPSRKEQLGYTDAGGRAFDPDVFDLSVVNAALQRVR